MEKNDLQSIRAILEAYRQTAKAPSTYTEGQEAAEEQFRLNLDDEIRRQPPAKMVTGSICNSITQSLILAIRPPKSVDDAIQRIKLVCGLDDRQAQVIKEIRLIAANARGQLRMRISEVVLTPERASAYFFTLGCLFGMSILLIVTERHPGFWLVMRGLGFGLAIGSMVGFVLARSLRIYPLLERLKAAEHWLEGTAAEPREA